jgi:prophage DNA circulation protein
VAYGGRSSVVTYIVAIEPVRTTGINWQSVLTMISSIVLLITVIIGAFLRQQSKAIGNAVSNLADKLESTFESKEKVGNLAARVSFLEEKMASLDSRRNNASP